MKYSYDGSSLKTEKTEPPPPARSSRQPVPVVRWRKTPWFVTLILFFAGVGIGSAFLGVWGKLAAICDRKIDIAAEQEKPDGGTAEARQKPERRPSVKVGDVRDYLTPSEAEMEQLYSYVANASFIAENQQYRDRLKDPPFVYIATNDTVNAFASSRFVEEDGKRRVAFKTEFFGGAARYARLVGLAAALQDAGHPGTLKKLVEQMPCSFCFKCNADECVRFVVESGLSAGIADATIRQRATSYSSGTIAYVIAHECGHHALGHLMRTTAETNLEISRNCEREADSFASSVISASPFGEYIFAGTLFWSYARSRQTDGDSDSGRSHPLWKERLENLVRNNRDKAAAMGITLE